MQPDSDFVSCPILFLTARIEDKDKLKGFAVGGDDYIVKPFSMDELGARVEAHLRREERRAGNIVRTKFDDDLIIDYSAQAVYFKGQQIPFQNREFEIIELLSSYPGQLFSKDRIYERIWDIDSEADMALLWSMSAKSAPSLRRQAASPIFRRFGGAGTNGQNKEMVSEYPPMAGAVYNHGGGSADCYICF